MNLQHFQILNVISLENIFHNTIKILFYTIIKLCLKNKESIETLNIDFMFLK